jgi:hypothetical protein
MQVVTASLPFSLAGKVGNKASNERNKSREVIRLSYKSDRADILMLKEG